MERSAIQVLAKRGLSQRQIARELGHSRVTVARALREPVDQAAAPRARTSVVDPFRPQIEQWVREGLTAVRMLELARADAVEPYGGSRSVFGDQVRQIRLALARADVDVPVRFEGLPGEYLQVDWGEIRQFPFTQRPAGTRYFLACRLKYSRWVWVRFTTDMRQETLFRGLIACVAALGWVPWVLVFDNMKTVTTGRDAQHQPIWTTGLLQLAAEFDFHPEACAVAAGNQKGSVESLVKWVKGNFLAGRVFADDADLGEQAGGWTVAVNQRPSAATGVPPGERLGVEAVQGGRLPATAADYGFPEPAQVTAESVVHVHGNGYSVPLAHVGAPVVVRLHTTRVVIWRDTGCIADHPRAPDGAHQRIIDPHHFAPLFAKKPRAQVMLYRAALLDLGDGAAAYVSEVSRRRRDRLRPEVLAIYRLFEAHGVPALLAAMERATDAGAYGAEYLQGILTAPGAHPLGAPAVVLHLPDVPAQPEVDRHLSAYEAYVQVDVAVDESDRRVAPLPSEMVVSRCS